MSTMEQQKISTGTMRTLSPQERAAMLKDMLFVSIISADNDAYDEDTKQDILRRYEENKNDPDWWYIFEPLGEERGKYAKLMEAI